MISGDASPAIRIRAYRSADAEPTLRIFGDAITVTAAADYTPEQVAAWARPERRGITEWDRSMLNRDSVVALVAGHIAGFSDVDDKGHIHMLFTAPGFARHGVARALMTFLEDRARRRPANQLTADVSITARVFFEAMGFRVVAEQRPVIDGVPLINYRMTKDLDPRE